MKVRTTFNPSLQVEVDQAELLDLRRQGLLVDEVTTPEPAAPVVAPPAATPAAPAPAPAAAVNTTTEGA